MADKPGQRYRHGWIPIAGDVVHTTHRGAKVKATVLSRDPGIHAPGQRGVTLRTEDGATVRRDQSKLTKAVAYPEIRKEDLSTPDGRRSRPVSSDEFQKIAAKGAAQYAKIKKGSTPPKGLDENFGAITNRAYSESRASWGGSTIDAHTGQFLAGDADQYAMTVRDPGMDTVSVSEKASRAEFAKAMVTARKRYADILSRPGHNLGVFHDDDKGTVDIDPVYVTGDKNETETIGAFTRTVGGAYHFKSGDGFWPPHVVDGK